MRYNTLALEINIKPEEGNIRIIASAVRYTIMVRPVSVQDNKYNRT